MNGDANVRQAGDRIEALLAEIRSMAAPAALARVEELVRRIVGLYGEGLAHITEIVGSQDADLAAVRERLLNDPLVASLLLLHDLHPVPVATRVAQALEKVRPYLGSHAGGVTLLGVGEDGVVRLRLTGSCDGCPSSLITVKMAIERAIEEHAPELVGVEVEGLTEAGFAPIGAPPASDARLPLYDPTSHGTGRGSPHPHAHAPAEPRGPAVAWAPVEGLHALPSGATTAVTVGGASVLVCRVGESLFAYRNTCASCGSTLTQGGLDDDLLTCPGCRQRYDVRLAGRSPESRELHLDPLPLLTDAESVKIAVALGGP